MQDRKEKENNVNKWLGYIKAQWVQCQNIDDIVRRVLVLGTLLEKKRIISDAATDAQIEIESPSDNEKYNNNVLQLLWEELDIKKEK